MEAAEVIGCCRDLARYSEEPGCTTRTFLSAPMRDVHAALTMRMTNAGMSVRVDAAGNLRGVYAATTPDAPRLVIGSHLDTVRRAGAFDGILGVVLGVGLIERLAGPLPIALEVVGFSEEEGVRFGVPFIGSRALVGSLDEATLARRDPTGRTVRDAIIDYGLDPDRLGEALLPADAIGFVEFHIEQGPVLETRGVPLGVVDQIAGQTRLEVAFTGAAGHAGTTPMANRRDALAGAAEWIAAVEQAASSEGGLVATVGRLSVSPGAANVIPGLCRASLDVRHVDNPTRAAAVERFIARAGEVAARRGLTAEWEAQLEQPTVPMDPSLVAAVEQAVSRAGYPVHRLASGAGHDAMILASRVPAALLFVRTPGGLSHHPEESVLEVDVAAALQAGDALLDLLARRVDG